MPQRPTNDWIMLPWWVVLATWWLARQVARWTPRDAEDMRRYDAMLDMLLLVLPARPEGWLARMVRDRVVRWIYEEQARLAALRRMQAVLVGEVPEGGDGLV